MTTQLKQLPSGVSVGPVSSGTLRPEDVIPVMLDLLRDLGSDKYEGYRDDWDEMFDDEGNLTESTLDYGPADLWFDVELAINEVLPVGYWFGNTEGDGACFGVWTDEADIDLD